MTARIPALTLEELRIAVDSGEIDTVVLALADMQGRLQGKRFHAPFFLDEVVAHGSEGCNYLLAVDVDMNTVDGYAMSSWERGYGDFAMVPDIVHAAPGAVAARHRDGAGRPALARRHRRRRARLAAPDPAPPARPARRARADRVRRHRAGVRALPRLLRGRLEARLPRPDPGEPLQRRLLAARHRAGRAAAAPHPQRDGRRRAGAGERQGRVQPRPARDRVPVRRRADVPPTTTSIYKNGAKEIAAQEGMSITFMAKPNQREGNSCHIHFSLRDRGRAARRCSATGRRHLSRHRAAGAGRAARHDARAQPASSRRTSTRTSGTSRARSRRPRCAGASTTAPARCGWPGTARACRVENRVPGADVNPYLAIAALVAGALHGIEERAGAGGRVHRQRVRRRDRAPGAGDAARGARRCGRRPPVAQAAFGDEVVAHYANNARVELAAFDAAVTDWELVRGFERL